MNQIKELFQYLFQSFKFWVIIQPWEQGLRVRAGKKIKRMNGGLYFRIPYLDSIYVQETRLRIADLAMQTLTSKDFKTITIGGCIGYSITDLEKLYKTLYLPEVTISNLSMSEISAFVFQNDMADISPSKLEEAVLKKLNTEDYGLKFEYFKINNFAVVRTLRLIQDQSWISEGLRMSEKK